MVEEGWLTAADRATMVVPATIEYKRVRLDGRTRRLPARDGASTSSSSNRSPLTDDEINRRGYSIVTTIQQPLQDRRRRTGRRPSVRHARRTRTAPVPDALTRVSLSVGRPQGRRDRRPVRRCRLPHRPEEHRHATTTSRPARPSSRSPSSPALEQGVALDTRFNGQSPRRRSATGRSATSAAAQFGSIDLVEATAQSVNTVYAQLNLQVGAGQDGRGRRARGRPGARRHQPRQRARHRVVHADRHGRRLRHDRLRRHPGRPVHRPHRRQRRGRLGRVRAQGPDGAGVRPGRHRRHDLRDEAGGREGLGQDVDQAARPADRRQDRDDARTTSRRGSSGSPRTSSPRCR